MIVVGDKREGNLKQVILVCLKDKYKKNYVHVCFGERMLITPLTGQPGHSCYYVLILDEVIKYKDMIKNKLHIATENISI